MEAGRADASSVERVPPVPTGAEPFVFLKLAVWNNGWIVGDRIHDRHYDLDPDPQHPSAPSDKHRSKALTPI